MQKRSLVISVFLGGILFGVTISTIHAAIRGSAIFTDIPSGHYADDAIGQMYELGIVKGMDSDTFGLNQPITRADTVILLKRLRDEIKGITSSSSSRSTASSSSSSSSSVSESSSSSSSYNPAGYFRFSSNAYAVEKNVSTGEVAIDIVRTGGNQGSGTIDYVFGSGTAIPGTDYDPISGTLAFATKETSKQVKIKIKNSGGSGHKTVLLVLKNPTGSIPLGTPSSVVLTITDPNTSSSSSAGYSSSSSAAGGEVSFSSLTYGVWEGETLTVTVKRTGITTAAVGVNYATSNGSADGSDYSPASGTLSFASGETSKTFTVSTGENSDVDGNRVFNMTLSSPTGGAALTTSAATAAINDDEIESTGSGSVKFKTSIFTVTETQGSAVITIDRVGALTAANVGYATSNGSAISPADYQATSGTMFFAAGETSKTFTIPVAKDANTETEETVTLTLSSPVGATLLDPSVATLKIYQ